MTAKGVMFSTGALLPLVIVFLALTSPLAKGATAGELLEKTIYAEETAGNLDEAIKLYEQVIAEAKTAKSAAAKAQYRLGLIYEKQGKAEPAAAAFRAVGENFPDEKELVAQARKHLPSEVQLLPAPWGEGDELQLNMKLATGLDIGTMIYRIEAAKPEGKDVWHCTTRGLVTANGPIASAK
ncbi:MAG: tetratricopeptide repeat protein [Pirellulales bacterium]|nr:tetratricopeptide repeat protein [Pirellulales bacterium]